MRRVVWALACLAACDFTMADDFTPTPMATADTASAVDPTGCVDVFAESVTSQLVAGDTTDFDNTGRPSCGSNPAVTDGPEMRIGFTAPITATYEFDLVGPGKTSFDTVLAVYDQCGGAELACNEDFDPTIRQSRVTLGLVADQFVVVQVDGLIFGAEGPFVLSIEALSD